MWPFKSKESEGIKAYRKSKFEYDHGTDPDWYWNDGHPYKISHFYTDKELRDMIREEIAKSKEHP